MSETPAYQPQLTLWSHVWRTGLVTVLTALAWWESAGMQWREARALFWLDVAGGVVSFVLMFFRRRWPFAIAAITAAIGFFSTSSAGPGVLAAVSMATRRRVGEIVFVGLLAFCGSVVFISYEPVPLSNQRWVDYTFLAIVTFAVLAIGMYIGSRRELLWTLRDRAERAEAEQVLRLDQARANERARIAREMHDVLAHRISLVTMHSGALAYRTDLTPEQVRESAAVIQAKANEALTDLRQVLGVLRDDATTGSDSPQPTYADVPALVDEARVAGMKVELVTDVALEVPDHLGRTVYRVVQEGLTNARKHAPHAIGRVTVAGSGDGVCVTVWNPTRAGHHTSTPGAGLGLVGLNERVLLAGGRLTHQSDSRGFTLTAWLPFELDGG